MLLPQKNLNMPACVYIPSEVEDMENLYSLHQRFVGRFDFSDWILKKTQLQKNKNMHLQPFDLS
jgi:hypothetical protein